MGSFRGIAGSICLLVWNAFMAVATGAVARETKRQFGALPITVVIVAIVPWLLIVRGV